MSLSLCDFVVFTTKCLVSSHGLLFVLVFSVLFSIVIISRDHLARYGASTEDQYSSKYWVLIA